MNLTALAVAPVQHGHAPLAIVEALYASIETAVVAHTQTCVDAKCPVILALSTFESVISGLAITYMEGDTTCN